MVAVIAGDRLGAGDRLSVGVGVEIEQKTHLINF